MRHIWTPLFLALIALALPAVRLFAQVEPLSFDLQEGIDRHRLFQDETVQAHLTLQGGPPQSLVVAFPAGNSGMQVVWGTSGEEEPLPPLEWGSPPRAVEDPVWGHGLQFGLHIPAKSVRIALVLQESIRFLRDLPYPEAIATRIHARIRHMMAMDQSPIGLLEPTGSVEETASGQILRFVRVESDGRHRYGLAIRLPPGVTASQTTIGWLLRGTAPQMDLEISAWVDFPSLRPFAAEDLLRPEATAWLQARLETDGPAADRLREAFQGLRFLCSRDKILAGSWRYLTYFGRDTLLSLSLLQDCLSPQVFAAGLQSVLDRLSPDGQVAHEEDIGGQAIHRHLEEAAAPGAGLARPRLNEPVFDYKMVDDDFLLPIALERFLDDPAVSARERQEFLENPCATGISNLEAALQNMEWCLRHSFRFLGKAEASRLIGITHPSVGDWRDSEAGLGWGRYSGNVNLVLVPTALRSIARLLARLPVPEAVIQKLCSARRLPFLHRLLRHPDLAQRLERQWGLTKDLFRVAVSGEELRAAAQAYLAADIWAAPERDWLRSQPLGQGTLGDFLDGKQVTGDLHDGLAFPALSLSRDGTPVRVSNSDVGFELFFGDPSPGELEEILHLLRLPFPLGLRTPVGILVANPVLAGPRLWQDLDRKAYHGLVVWGWQQAMIEKGLLRQIGRWQGQPGAESLVVGLRDCLRDITSTEVGLGRLANSELWSWKIRDGKMVPLAFGAESGTETQANPVQLWSTVHLSVARERDEAGLGR